MAQDSARLHLPMLRVGQAQKEATHNKALTLPDMATQPSVVAIDRNVPPTSPAIGQCCIVGPAQIGIWAGQAGALAGWTVAGWRFVAAREGMVVALEGGMLDARYRAGHWVCGVVAAAAVMVDGLSVLVPGSRRSPPLPVETALTRRRGYRLAKSLNLFGNMA